MSAHDIQWKMKCGLKYYPKWPILPMAVIEGNCYKLFNGKKPHNKSTIHQSSRIIYIPV